MGVISRLLIGLRNQPSFTIPTLGKPLFTAPVNRSLQEWLQESRAHGWPSFRDAKVNWDTVRTLRVTARLSRQYPRDTFWTQSA